MPALLELVYTSQSVRAILVHLADADGRPAAFATRDTISHLDIEISHSLNVLTRVWGAALFGFRYPQFAN